MDYIKIRFGNDFGDIESKFEKTIEEMLQSAMPMFTVSQCAWKPPMDMYETPDEIIIIGEIAGVSKEDLHVEINNKAIKIFGKRTGTPPSANARFRLAEIQYGTFERVLFLPAPVDTDKVFASYSNGFLKIGMAKRPLDTVHKVPIENG